MVIPKPPIEFCIDSFEYKEFVEDGWNGPVYKDAVLIDRCRIDRGAEYSQSTSGKTLLFNAIVFCYEGITTPLPEFKTESIIQFDGVDHKVTKVIPNYEAYKPVLYSYELEVI